MRSLIGGMMTINRLLTFLEYVNVRKHNKEWQFMADGYLPLSPAILKDFEVDVKDVYHVTTIAGLKKLARLQGKRVDVSGFTKGSKGVSKGLLNDAEVLVTLDGKSSIQFDRDANTRTDRNGIRWLSPGGNISKRLNDIVRGFKDDILKKIVKKLEVPKELKKGKEEYIFKGKLHTMDKIIHLSDATAISNYLHKADGKTKKQLIKHYYDEAKKLINTKLIKQMNDAVKWSDYKQFSHNEVLIHNFKITGSKLIRSSDPDKAEKMWKKAEKAGMTRFDVIDAADVEKL